MLLINGIIEENTHFQYAVGPNNRNVYKEAIRVLTDTVDKNTRNIIFLVGWVVKVLPFYLMVLGITALN